MFRGMTLRKKIAVLLTVSVLIVAFAAWGVTYHVERERLISSNQEVLSRYLASLAIAGEKEGLEGIKATLPMWIDAYPDGRITVIDSAGTVLLDNKAEPFEMDNHYKRPEVIGAFSHGSASEVRYSKTQGEWINYSARKVILAGAKPEGIVVRVSYPIEKLKDLGWSTGRSFLYALEILLILVWGGAYWMLKVVMRPLASLSRAAETIAAGGLARFPITEDPEMQGLSNALNSMSDSLKLSIKEAHERKEEISQLVGALPIGLVLIDDLRKIRYINASAAMICGYGQVLPARGASIEIILPSEEMIKQLDEKDGTALVTLPRRGGMKIEVTTLTITRGRLIVLQDLTEKIRLEEVRRDFFIDAGHEFQTPLTVIRMGLDLLKSGGVLKDSDDIRTVDSMILQQERISNLVDDLLFLVRLDIDPLKSGQDDDVNIKNLVEDLVADIKGLHNINDTVLNVTLPDEAVIVKGRYDDLRRALFNLLENSVKYVASIRNTGGRVDFSVNHTERELEIRVDDNGPGVHDVDADVIFERFRRGDSHRARNSKGTGGYGLGLSISRRIAERHGGSLELVKSKLGGASFLMTLPSFTPQAHQAEGEQDAD